MKTFGGLLRNYKADLRAKYSDLETKTEEEIKELVPNRVNNDQWVIEKWFSEESQRVGMNNKRNRSRQTLLHTAGTKSFARVAAEMTKSDGVAPSHAKLFIKTHTRKDGSIFTEETREKIEKINEKITEDPNDRMDQVGTRQLRNLIFVLQALAIILPLNEYGSIRSSMRKMEINFWTIL